MLYQLIKAIKNKLERIRVFCTKIFNEFINIKLSNNFFLNVNFPSSDKEQIKGIKIVKMSERKPGKLKKIDNNNYIMPSEKNSKKC